MNKVKIIEYKDKLYPQKLLNIKDFPKKIYALGNIELLNKINEVLEKLIRLIKSITVRPIEIGVMPVRTELISFLDRYGFVRNQADYFRNIGEF